MRTRLARACAVALLLAALPASADVLLNGSQHIGDCDDTGGGCAGFTPLDPVSRNQMFNYPVNFHLSAVTTIDKVQLDGAVDLDGRLQIYLETQGTSLGSSSAHFGTLTGSTFDLIPDLVLAAGDYVIFPDGGCSESSGGTFFYNCPGDKNNDFSFSSITLVSAQTSTSLALNQRRHLGDNTDPSGDDDYDFTGNVNASSNQFYPDAAEGSAIDLSFTLTADRRLTQVRFYRLRDINSTDAQVLVDGTFIGNLTGNGDPFTLSPGLLLLAGTHTLRIQSGTLSAQFDDFSWDDISLRFTDESTAGTPGFFNAVDVGELNPVSGVVRTKTAGGAFTLNLYALNGFGTGQLVTYNGSADVELLNASNSSGAQDVYGCSGTWQFAQSLGAVIFVGGYAQVSGTFLDAGLREARIRVTDSATQAKGCSLDNFAVRPASFSVVPSHNSEDTAGTATALTNTADSGLPRHKAGQPFTIVATALGAGGAAATSYDGTPEVASPLQVIGSATTEGSLTGVSWGSASGGARRTDTAKYSEVGAFTLELEDTTYADVDADDTAANVRTFSGSVGAGRFTPDHFKVTEGELAPACALGGFSYLGSTLTWASPAVTLTAVDASNATTQNYAGTLDKLPDDLAAATYAVYDNPALSGTPALNAAGLTPDVTDATAGVATITLLPGLSFARSLIGAFDAEIQIDLPAFTDEDGIAPEELPNIVIGSATAGAGVAFTGNAKSQRFGRLYFEPKYGSERLPLNVPLRAEYFDGVAFLPNIADVCTTLTTGDVTLAPLGGQVHAVTANGNGRWTVTLSAPNVSGQAGLSVDLTSGTPVPYPLLRADANSDGTYAEDPATTVTFGIHSQEDRRIYQREVVGSN